MRANFMETLDNMVIKLLKIVCPILRIPGYGDELVKKLKGSYTFKMLHCGWTMLSLM